MSQRKAVVNMEILPKEEAERKNREQFDFIAGILHTVTALISVAAIIISVLKG